MVKISNTTLESIDTILLSGIDNNGNSYLSRIPYNIIDRLFFVSASESAMQKFCREETYFMSKVESICWLGTDNYRNTKLNSPKEMVDFYNEDPNEYNMNCYAIYLKKHTLACKQSMMGYLSNNCSFFNIYPWLIRRGNFTKIFDVVKPLITEECRRVSKEDCESLTLMGWLECCKCMWYKIDVDNYPSYKDIKDMVESNTFPTYAPYKIRRNNHIQSGPPLKILSYDLEVLHCNGSNIEFPSVLDNEDIIGIASVIEHCNNKTSSYVYYVESSTEFINEAVLKCIEEKRMKEENDVIRDTIFIPCEDESDLLYKLLKHLASGHILTGWGISHFDAKWILFKSFFLLGCSHPLVEMLCRSSDFYYKEEVNHIPSISNYMVCVPDGKNNHYKLCFPHQLHLDGLLVAMKFIQKTSSYTLNAVSDAMGFGKKKDVDVLLLNKSFIRLFAIEEDDDNEIDKSDLSMWVDGLFYCALDSFLAFKIFNTQTVFLMNSLMILSDTNVENVIQTSARLPHVLDAIIHMFYNLCRPPTFDILDNFGNVLSRANISKYAGAKVLEVKKGIIMGSGNETDVKSLYPSMAREHKLCGTTTFILPYKLQEPSWLQEIKHNFRSIDIYEANNDTPVGTMYSLKEFGNGVEPIVSSYFAHKLDAREKVKKDMKILKSQMGQGDNDEEKAILLNVYDNTQLALKLVANGAYGLFGDTDSIFYNICVAGGITHYGYRVLEFLETTSIKIATTLFDETFGSKEQAILNKEIFPIPASWCPPDCDYGKEPCTFQIACGDTDSIFCFGNFLMKTDVLHTFYEEFNSRLNDALASTYSRLVQVESGGEFDVLCNTVKKRYFLVSRTGHEKTRGIQKCDKQLKRDIINIYVRLGLYTIMYNMRDEDLNHPVFIDFLKEAIKHFPDFSPDIIENDCSIDKDRYIKYTSRNLEDNLLYNLTSILTRLFSNFEYCALYSKVKNLETYKQPPPFAVYAYIEDIEGAGFHYVKGALKDVTPNSYDSIFTQKTFDVHDFAIDTSKLLNAFMHFEDYLSIVSSSSKALQNITHNVPYSTASQERDRLLDCIVAKKQNLKIFKTPLNYISLFSLASSYGIFLDSNITNLDVNKTQRILKVVTTYQTIPRVLLDVWFSNEGHIFINKAFWCVEDAISLLKRRHVGFSITGESNSAVRHIILFVIQVLHKHIDIKEVEAMFEEQFLLLCLDFGVFLFKDKQFKKYYISVKQCYTEVFNK